MGVAGAGGQRAPVLGDPPARAGMGVGATGTHVLRGAQELCARVAGEHADDDHLTPLLHVDEQVAELPVVLVDQVNALRAHLLKSHHHATRHQLGSRQRPEGHGEGGQKGFCQALSHHPACAPLDAPWSCRPGASQ